MSIVRPNSREPHFMQMGRHIARMPRALKLGGDEARVCVFPIPVAHERNTHAYYAFTSLVAGHRESSLLWPGRGLAFFSALTVSSGWINDAMDPPMQDILIAFEMELLKPQPNADADVVIRLRVRVVEQALAAKFDHYAAIAEYALRSLLWRNHVVPPTAVRFTATSRDDMRMLRAIAGRIYGRPSADNQHAFTMYIPSGQVAVDRGVLDNVDYVTATSIADEQGRWESTHWTVPVPLNITADRQNSIPVMMLQMRYVQLGRPSLEMRDGDKHCRMHVWAGLRLSQRFEDAPPPAAGTEMLASVNAYVWFEGNSHEICDITFDKAHELRSDSPEVLDASEEFRAQITPVLHSALFMCMRAALVLIIRNIFAVTGYLMTHPSWITVSAAMEHFTPVHHDFFPGRNTALCYRKYFAAHPSDATLWNDPQLSRQTRVRIVHDAHVYAFREEMLHRLTRVGLKAGGGGTVAAINLLHLHWWFPVKDDDFYGFGPWKMPDENRMCSWARNMADDRVESDPDWWRARRREREDDSDDDGGDRQRQLVRLDEVE